MVLTAKEKLNMILKYMGKESLHNIDLLVVNQVNQSYMSFSSEEQLKSVFEDYMNTFYDTSSNQDIDTLRYYTGIAYREVNPILRGYWNYEESGLLTEEKKEKAIKLSEDIDKIISSVAPLPFPLRVYRGVNLDSFKDYGVSSLDDLLKLKDQYYYDESFVSTSLLRDRSFFDRDLDWHKKCNIEIEYLVPENSNDGIPLISDALSYSKNQTEFLINKGSLSKIVDVSIDSQNQVAYLKAVLVPKKL